MKIFSGILMTMFLLGCSGEPEFEHYGIYAEGLNDYQQLKAVSGKDADKFASNTTQVSLGEGVIRFYVYQKDFDAERFQLLQMDLLTKKTNVLDINVSPREQEQSYILSAKVVDDELPIFMLMEKKSWYNKVTYMVSTVDVEGYFVGVMLSTKTRNTTSRMRDVESLLKTFPGNPRLLTERSVLIEKAEKAKAELEKIQVEKEEKAYKVLVEARETGIAWKTLISKYDTYLRQFPNGLHKAEIFNSAGELRKRLSERNRKALAEEKSDLKGLADRFILAIDKKDQAAIAEITVKSSTASRVLKNKLFSRVKVGSVGISSYKKSGKKMDKVQIQLDGGVFMIRAQLIENEWRVVGYAARSGKWFKMRKAV
ncbi:hypothetical protein A9Q81_16850 [Gammaproteobacteria bacterium 42_54_T18]|nr:hypothetical protein A9Q81_16850 [Gammaproteobacteria bacterium 42_54_T18]